MPMDITKYPKDWKQISLRIRERDGNRCKWCGVPNGAQIIRSVNDAEEYVIYDEETGGMRYSNGERIRMSEVPDEFQINPYVRVVLTVAHLNHDTADNSDENLAALCQLHHLRHDAQHHASNAAMTRVRKRKEALREAGQEALF